MTRPFNFLIIPFILMAGSSGRAQDSEKIAPQTKTVLSGRSEIGPNSNEEKDQDLAKRQSSWSRSRSQYAAGRTSNAPGASNTTPAQGGNTFGTEGNPLPDERK